MFVFSILFYFILQIDAKNNVRLSICSMTWYKTVTYRKTRFVQIIPPNWGGPYHFDWPARLIACQSN